MPRQERIHRADRIVPRPIGRRARRAGELRHDAVARDDVAAGRDQRRVQFEFGLDMRAAVIGVEDHQRMLARRHARRAPRRRWPGSVELPSISEMYERQRMRLDRRAVVRPDFDVDADRAAMPHRGEQAGVEHQRAAMRDAGLDDHVGAEPPDHLLDADHVLRKLDDRAAHPTEAVDVFHVPAAAQPGCRHRLERLGRVQRMLLFACRRGRAELPGRLAHRW